MAKPRIHLYTRRKCPHCQQLKTYLKDKKIPFTEWDIEGNRKAISRFQQLGARGVPVLTIGESRLDGFQPRRLAPALRKAGFVL